MKLNNEIKGRKCENETKTQKTQKSGKWKNIIARKKEKKRKRKRKVEEKNKKKLRKKIKIL